MVLRIDLGSTCYLNGHRSEAEAKVSLHWYPTEDVELQVGYDLIRLLRWREQ